MCTNTLKFTCISLKLNITVRACNLSHKWFHLSLNEFLSLEIFGFFFFLICAYSSVFMCVLETDRQAGWLAGDRADGQTDRQNERETQMHVKISFVLGDILIMVTLR